ncbi:MAG: hypothetical protein Fur0010_18490 [Bdellovibrio sp.]
MIIAVVSVILNLVLLGIGTYIHLKQNDKTYSSFEACYFGMKSIFENNSTDKLVHKKVLDDLKTTHFEVEDITLVKVVNGLHCDVVAKDSNGYRSYAVTLEKSSKFDRLYRIFDVRGQKMVSSYQWRSIEGDER